MVRYFYAWTPFVVVGTGALLALPWLGLIALMVVPFVAVAAVGALAWAIVSVLVRLTLAVGHLWGGRSDASPRTAAALSPATSQHA